MHVVGKVGECVEVIRHCCRSNAAMQQCSSLLDCLYVCMLTRVNEVVKLWCIGAVGKCVEHDRVANGKEGNQEAVEHGVEPNQLHCTKTKEEEEEEEERERERGGGRI